MDAGEEEQGGGVGAGWVGVSCLLTNSKLSPVASTHTWSCPWLIQGAST